MIVINAIVMTISPTIYKKLANNNLNIKWLYKFMGLFIVVGIIIWLGSLIIFPYMVNTNFLVAKDLLFFFALAFVFRGWYQLFYNIIVNEGKTSYFVKIMWQSTTINIVFNYIFINIFGMIGAPMATTLAFLYMFFSLYILVQDK